MIKLIHEELFSSNMFVGENSRFPGLRHHMELRTATGMYRRRSADEPTNYDIGNGKVTVSKFDPVNMRILTMHSFDNDFFQHPHGLRVDDEPQTRKNEDNGRPTPQMVDIRCNTDDRPNRANIYVIAFPFNGKLIRIPHDPKYRIYKGLVVTSWKAFTFNNRKYRKILYLVIEPNLNLFTPDHKYHTDEIEIHMEAINSVKGNAERTARESCTVTITNQEGLFVVIDTHDIEERPFADVLADAEAAANERAKQIAEQTARARAAAGDPPREDEEVETNNNLPWTVFRFEPRDPNEPPKQQEMQMRTPPGVRITTNRHGIRKEVPIKPRAQKPRLDSQKKPERGTDSLDAMIKNADLVSEKEYRYAKRSGGFKKHKKNRR